MCLKIASRINELSNWMTVTNKLVSEAEKKIGLRMLTTDLHNCRKFHLAIEWKTKLSYSKLTVRAICISTSLYTCVAIDRYITSHQNTIFRSQINPLVNHTDSYSKKWK